MKAALSLVAVALVLAALFLTGCVLPGTIGPTKPTPDGEPIPPPEQSEGAKAPAPSDQAAEQPLPPPPPGYKPPSPPDREKIVEGSVDLRLKDEVNEAAMRFAKEIPNVKHVKTCYSKLYGGWYLMLYLEKGKKISMEQFSWNGKTKEWEVAGQFQVPAKQLDYHLKGEVADEKCFRLK